jgi:DNA-directed RNA polymerase subunit K/omega
MVNRPSHINAYEFAVLSALRAQQLIAGCVPRVAGTHNAPTMAQMEVAAGQVCRLVDEAAPAIVPTT